MEPAEDFENIHNEENTLQEQLNSSDDHVSFKSPRQVHYTPRSQSSTPRPKASISTPRQHLIRNRPHSAPPSKAPTLMTDHRKSNKVVSKDEWKDTLKRFEEYEKTKALKKENKKKELENSELKEMRAVPQIDQHSKKLIRNHEDLIQRMFILLEETLKKRKVAKEQQDLALSKAIKKSPDILPQSKELKRGPAIINEWNEQKTRRLKEERARKVVNEEKSLQKYFKPQINSKSVQILEKRKHPKDVTQRMLQDLEQRERKAEILKNKETEELFHPQINHRSKNIKQEKPVFDRLYNDGVRIMLSKQKLMVDHWDNAWDVEKPKTLVEPLSRLSRNFTPEDIEVGINNLTTNDFESALEQDEHIHVHSQTDKNDSAAPTPFDLRRVMLDTYYGYAHQHKNESPSVGYLQVEEAARRRLSLN